MNISKQVNNELIAELEGIAGKKLNVGNLLWSIRNGEELSQALFAEKLGISKQYLSDLENGRRHTSLKAAIAYANKLGYPVEQFVRLYLQELVDREGLNMIIHVDAA